MTFSHSIGLTCSRRATSTPAAAGSVIQLVDSLVKSHVRFVAIKEGIHLDGKQDMQTKVRVTLFSLFAEIERDLISDRRRELNKGLSAARARGKKPGRPKGSQGKSKLSGREEEIRTLLSKAVSKSSIAKIMDVSRTTLQHFVQSRGVNS